MSGRVVKSESFQHNGGMFEEKINVGDLSKGIYMIHIQTERGCSVEKFIRQ